MDIRSFFGASTSSSVASSSTHMEKESKCSDSDSDIAEPFIEALGTWVEESILKRLQKVIMFGVMADECTDIMAVEELSVFCH